MAAASAEAPAEAVMVPRYGWKSPVMALTASNTANCVIAAKRAWLNGSALTVVSIIPFHSPTTSALLIAVPNNSVITATAFLSNRLFPMLFILSFLVLVELDSCRNNSALHPELRPKKPAMASRYLAESLWPAAAPWPHRPENASERA